MKPHNRFCSSICVKNMLNTYGACFPPKRTNLYRKASGHWKHVMSKEINPNSHNRHGSFVCVWWEGDRVVHMYKSLSKLCQVWYYCVVGPQFSSYRFLNVPEQAVYLHTHLFKATLYNQPHHNMWPYGTPQSTLFHHFCQGYAISTYGACSPQKETKPYGKARGH